ncbi:hypothetical protein pEaSNUABM13_00329 [Erwinia phage pEa_SNUABM_13]|nr:hypothetical protein pEaSNUABM13_00329 [Erwinia phage pEa_SNUABM_13]QYW05341.1 hypothetical protein pEaSNUABM21_00327 [Erwinia phage pEa_SNUABM_21]QYW05681.1 hypothetical protein pEaSNUABM25_00325 [Erwinia phage pEa_SNUABM_25]
MSEQVDHATNIIKMVSDRDAKISELSVTANELQGQVNDYAAELAASAVRETALRLKLRSQERQTNTDLVRLETRTKELVDISNTQMAESNELKARVEEMNAKLAQVDPMPFVLHLVAVQAASVFSYMVQSFAHAHVNQRTNDTTRTLSALMVGETARRYQSFEKTIARYCNSIGAERPKANDVRNAFPDFMRNEADLFCKDPKYSHDCMALAAMLNLPRTSWMYRKSLDAVNHFAWIAAFEGSPQEFESESDYNELYVNSLIDIASALIGQNF